MLAIRCYDRFAVFSGTVVVAAGNDGSNACYESPASATDVVTVGASDNADARAYFSNFGGCVDIFAPGTSLYSVNGREWVACRGFRRGPPNGLILRYVLYEQHRRSRERLVPGTRLWVQASPECWPFP